MLDLPTIIEHIKKNIKKLDLSVLGSNFKLANGPEHIHEDGKTNSCMTRKFYSLEDIRKEINSGKGEY